MALSLSEKEHKPPRIVIYGCEGIGKSTFGSLAPNPVFIPVEDGLDVIDVPAFKKAESFTEFMSYLGELATQDHEFETVCIDSLDWLEPLIWKEVCAQRNVNTIEDIGYGKGYLFSLDLWNQYFEAINYLRDEKKMMIIQIAHAEIKRFENPETDAYDRYNIKLHKKAAEKVLEHADLVLFANNKINIKKEDAGFGKDRKRALGGKERLLFTTERPVAIAKSRYDLPSEILFDKEGQYWMTLVQAIPFFKSKLN